MTDHVRPQIGQKLVCKAELFRARYEPGTPDVRKWKRIEHANPYTAHYIGWRTYSNGKMLSVRTAGYYDEPDGYYDELVYSADHHFEVWLVVENDRLNPVAVLPEDVTVLNGG